MLQPNSITLGAMSFGVKASYIRMPVSNAAKKRIIGACSQIGA